MPAPPGNELNAVFPEQKVELRRTCVRVLDKSISPMQSTFDCRFPQHRRGHRRASGMQIPGLRASIRLYMPDQHTSASHLLVCRSSKQQQIPIRILYDEIPGPPRLLFQRLVKGNTSGLKLKK